MEETSWAKWAADYLSTSVDSLASEIFIILGGLTAVGFLAATTLDLIKNVLQPKVAFHKLLLHRIFQSRYQSHNKDFLDFLRKEEAQVPPKYKNWFANLAARHTTLDALGKGQFVELVESRISKTTTGGDVDLLYSYSAELMVAEIRGAVSLALSQPRNTDNVAVVVALSDNVPNEDLFDVLSGLVISEDRRQHIESLIDGNLKGLQSQLVFYWRWIMHVSSVALSVGLIWSLSPGTIGWLIFAIAGGLIAPFAHDLSSLVGKALKP